MSIEASIAGFTRAAMFDPLRASRFWLYDVAPIDGITLPIFQPLSGFNAITSPEITVETLDFHEGNFPFTRHVVKSADVGNITLTRGVTFYNADFFNWIKAALSGTTGVGNTNNESGFQGFKLNQIGGVTYRRSLLLVHFFRNFGVPGLPSVGDVARRNAAIAATAATGAAISAGTGVLLDSVGAGIASAANLTATSVWGGLQPHSLGIKIPARAFLLQNCVPIRYKSGSDFDASSGDVSIQELEIAVEMMEEISLAA